MSRKIINLAIFGYLSVMATTAMAVVPQDTSTETTLHSFYIEGAGGWASSNWIDSLNYIFPSQTTAKFTNLSGGGIYGGDVGYQLNRYFSIEVGAFSLPNVSYSIQSQTNVSTDVGTISNWLIDFAGKATLPITSLPGLDVFGKFGAVYRAGNFTDNEIKSGVAQVVVQPTVFNIIEPILGGGLQYQINKHWSVNAQYLFVPYGILSTTVLGPNGQDHISIPAAQMVTGGVRFNF